MDDAKVIKPIRNESDIINFQEDLNFYDRWALDNNMIFNGEKYVSLRYGTNENLKQDYTYFSGPPYQWFGGSQKC